jgi:hypothetical protein
MSRQYFADLNADPPIANLTAVTATAETGLWNVPQYSPIQASEGRPGKVWRLYAGGIMSFAGTGTLTITPRFGTTTSGVTLGASVAQTTPGATTNQPWLMEMILVCRTLGAPGANSTVIGSGSFVSNATASAGTAVAFAFGGTSATVDLSVANGLFIGWTLSVAGTVTPQFVVFGSLN